MRNTLQTSADPVHHLRPEIQPVMAKADLRKPEIAKWREEVGHAVERMRLLRGWTLKELAGEIGHDERQVRAWIKGDERPQFDVLFSVASLRQPLVVALAEMAGGAGVEVTTTITVKRTA